MDFLIDGSRIGLFRGAKNFNWEAGAWDQNYNQGVDFMTMISLFYKIQVKTYLMRGQTLF